MTVKAAPDAPDVRCRLLDLPDATLAAAPKEPS
jgi:hypothetical protein